MKRYYNAEMLVINRLAKVFIGLVLTLTFGALILNAADRTALNREIGQRSHAEERVRVVNQAYQDGRISEKLRRERIEEVRSWKQ